MWLLPTRGRPKLCQEALDACYETGMTSDGLLIIDTRAGSYPYLHIPDNWSVIRGPLDMADAMRIAFMLYKNDKQFGWLADDLRPRTQNWDKLLEKEAGDWLLVHCNDLWIANSVSDRARSLCGAFCWGGELVRTVGWWALPDVRQAGIDDAWIDITHPDYRKYIDEIVVEHIQHKNGKRPKDDTDNWVRDDINYINQDFRLYEQLKFGNEFEKLNKLIKEAEEDEKTE